MEIENFRLVTILLLGRRCILFSPYPLWTSCHFGFHYIPALRISFSEQNTSFWALITGSQIFEDITFIKYRYLKILFFKKVEKHSLWGRGRVGHQIGLRAPYIYLWKKVHVRTVMQNIYKPYTNRILTVYDCTVFVRTIYGIVYTVRVYITDTVNIYTNGLRCRISFVQETIYPYTVSIQFVYVSCEGSYTEPFSRVWNVFILSIETDVYGKPTTAGLVELVDSFFLPIYRKNIHSYLTIENHHTLVKMVVLHGWRRIKLRQRRRCPTKMIKDYNRNERKQKTKRFFCFRLKDNCAMQRDWGRRTELHKQKNLCNYEWKKERKKETYFIWKELLVPRWSKSWHRQAMTKARHSMSPKIFHHWVDCKTGARLQI